MPNFPENYGLSFFVKDKDAEMGFIASLLEESKAITGYYGSPYLYRSLGDFEYWIQTENDGNKITKVKGYSTHCAGNCVWNLTFAGVDITPDVFPKTERVLLFEEANGSKCFLPVNLITADVLPGYPEGGKIRVQMIGLPLEIHYYVDADEYEKDQPANKDGKKWLIGNGALIPLPLLINHQADHGRKKNHLSDAVVHFVATVERLCVGSIELNGEKTNAFIRCFIRTQFGTLELNHSLEQVPEDQRQNMKVGAVISGRCILSGDAAIYEYQNGAIKDFPHDLELLCHTFSGDDPERLRSVLRDDSVYFTDTSGETFRGADDIIGKVKRVQKNSKEKCFAYPATVTVAAESAEYPADTRCIVLAYGTESNYEAIAFFQTDEEGMITRIRISTDTGYRFLIDGQPGPAE